jgi:hypothetical protein
MLDQREFVLAPRALKDFLYAPLVRQWGRRAGMAFFRSGSFLLCSIALRFQNLRMRAGVVDRGPRPLISSGIVPLLKLYS